MELSHKFPARFFMITFCWSWSLWLPLILAGRGMLAFKDDLAKMLYIPFTVLALFGPAIGAIVSLKTINGRGAAARFLKTFLDFRFGLKTWLVPAAILLVSTMIAWLVPELLGFDRLPMLLPNVWIFPVYWLLMVFLGGGQEEIGWRGYILAHLEKRLGVIPGSAVLSVVWAIWHLPLWLVPGAVQTHMSFSGFLMLTFGHSFLYSWGLKKAGNRPLAGMVMHGTANSLVPLFPTLSMQPGETQMRFWIWVSITFIVGLVFMLFLKTDRKQYSSTP